MKEIIEKISSYNLFNYLLPGVLYVVIIERITTYHILSNQLVISAFVCYFIGMVISRVGSLLVEEPLKKIGFLKFKDYKDFIEASKKDEKLVTLSEQNNTYRSLIAMILLLGITKLYELLEIEFVFLIQAKSWIVLLLLFGLFLAGYRKQTNFITERIEKNME